GGRRDVGGRTGRTGRSGPSRSPATDLPGPTGLPGAVLGRDQRSGAGLREPDGAGPALVGGLRSDRPGSVPSRSRPRGATVQTLVHTCLICSSLRTTAR